jgi:hypothetical protein
MNRFAVDVQAFEPIRSLMRTVLDQIRSIRDISPEKGTNWFDDPEGVRCASDFGLPFNGVDNWSQSQRTRGGFEEFLSMYRPRELSLSRPPELDDR